MQCLSLSPKFNPSQQPGCFKAFAWPLTQIHGVVKRSPSKKFSIKCCSQSSISVSNKNKFTHGTEGIITKRNHKTLNKRRTPLVLKDDDNTAAAQPAPRFLDVLKTKLTAISHLTRLYAQIYAIVAVTSACCLPLQSLSQVTPTFLLGVLKAILPTVMINIYVCSLNQICDVEIDKINKPYLPLASGDLSMPTGIAICAGSALLSIALGVISGSPAVFWAIILAAIIGAAYSFPLPFLRWKSHTFLAPFSVAIMMGPLLQIPYFIHIQTYVLRGPFVVTPPLIFATTIMSIFAFINGLLKDLPDVEGDKAFGMRTLCVLMGKEKVLLLCVNMMLLGYGGAVIAGASASLMTCKIVTIIGHSILAFWMWLRSRKVDLDKFESTFDFYMFNWKLIYIEYFLIHFLR